jgi:hypothetical protein
MKRASVFLFPAVLLTGYLFGQALSGTIVGTVTDQGGAVVPGARVTLTNEGTSFTRTVETNQSGQYVAYSFPTGKITITAERPGFQKLVRTGAELTAADTLAIDLKLQVGDPATWARSPLFSPPSSDAVAPGSFSSSPP